MSDDKSTEIGKISYHSGAVRNPRASGFLGWFRVKFLGEPEFIDSGKPEGLTITDRGESGYFIPMDDMLSLLNEEAVEGMLLDDYEACRAFYQETEAED